MSASHVAYSVDRPLLFAVVAAALVVLLMTVEKLPSEEVALDPRCEAWDEMASVAFAAAIAERSRLLEYQLGDAVFRLRRARRNCKVGWHELARLDYEALLEGRYAGSRAPLLVAYRTPRRVAE